MWEEGGDGHQNDDSEKATSPEAEERAQEPVEEAKADGVSCAVESFAEQGAEHHDADDDEKEGDDLGYRGCVDECFEYCRDMLVVPGGEQDSGYQAGKREELQD